MTWQILESPLHAALAAAPKSTPAATPTPTARPAPSATLTFADGVLRRDGAPHRVLAGSLHYFRVHPAHWTDRVDRVAEMGLNTIDTYVPWNFHESAEGGARFDGWRDVERFIGIAADAGLDVIVRPGPYICAEWDNGGLPAWLTARAGIRLRSDDRRFLDPVERWFDQLIPRIASLQAGHGGPVVAVQVENEFGSFGSDPGYLAWLRDALIERGITELLYTADGPTSRMQQAGTIPGVLATATFGSAPADAADLLRSRRDGEPFICAEFWNGWFDHWGERHHVRAAGDAADAVGDILDLNGSVSLYMAHGGTNFGLSGGANHDGSRLQPTVTSYDSDAPIAENGALTAKYFAIRQRLWPDACAEPLPFEVSPATLTPRVLPVTRLAGLLEGIRGAGPAVRAEKPPSFESLGQSSGLVLYRLRLRAGAGAGILRLTGAHDRAIAFVDGQRAGVIEAVDGEVTIQRTGAESLLEVLVENQGRINYGPLLGQGKGILGDVTLDGCPLRGWQAVTLPIDTWTEADLNAACEAGLPAGRAGFASATLTVQSPADAFLAFPGFGKGFVWVGETLLGRYWAIGPQRTLYLPGPLLHGGANTITVLELEHLGERIELRAAPDLGEPEEYVETF